MNPNALMKSAFHALAGVLTLTYALRWENETTLHTALWWIPATLMLLLAVMHTRLRSGGLMNSALFFCLEAAVLAVIAWRLYGMGLHRITFLYEGISVFYLSMAAFSFLIRRRSRVLFREEDI